VLGDFHNFVLSAVLQGKIQLAGGEDVIQRSLVIHCSSLEVEIICFRKYDHHIRLQKKKGGRVSKDQDGEGKGRALTNCLE